MVAMCKLVAVKRTARQNVNHVQNAKEGKNWAMKAVKRPISSKISSNNPSFHIEAHDSDVLVVSYHSTAPYSVVLFDLDSLINPVRKFFRVLYGLCRENVCARRRTDVSIIERLCWGTMQQETNPIWDLKDLLQFDASGLGLSFIVSRNSLIRNHHRYLFCTCSIYLKIHHEKRNE